jgi:DNA-binding response OmpR family regulator
MARVLIVDDDDNQRKALRIGLELDGFEVAVASSEPETFAMLAEEGGVDVALIDLMIPGLNGLDLARRIREAHPRVRVILSSAYHLSARQVERADCGACGFVPKPYQLAEVCSFVRAKTKNVSPAA